MAGCFTIRYAEMPLIVCTLVLLLSAPALGQYFGRNKVQYDRFDFRTFETEHFYVYYYPEAEEAARDGARMAERWYARFSKILNHQFADRKPIIFYANQADFQQTNVIQGLISEGTGGVTEGLKDRVVLPFTGSYRDNDHVIGHELVHAFQYDLARARFGSPSALGQAPLWLIEGMAEYLSLGHDDAHTAMWLRDAVLHDDIPTIDDLNRGFEYFPYRFGHGMWAYIVGRWGEGMIRQVFAGPRRTVQVPSGVAPAIDEDRIDTSDTVRAVPTKVDTLLTLRRDTLSRAWADELRQTYGRQIEGRTRPREAARRVLAADIDAGRTNLSPVLSPDGRFVAFLSERDVFAIDLFLADAVSGRVIRSIARSGSDQHFDQLSFTNSAGTWSPDGRRFAFVVYREGRNEIVVHDVDRNRIDRRIRIDTIGGIATPAWSPDGRAIAFAGNIGGIQNLFVYRLEDGSVRQLTHGKYADWQPCWSPDGRTIAFATDRGPGTSFDEFTFAPMQIGFLDVQTGRIDVRSPFEESKHINPQYSPDGSSIYFVSDRGGFNDVYRLDLASGRTYQVTRVATGVSGLTAQAPALSVAQQSGRMMFTLFEHREYNGYSLEPEQTAGTEVVDLDAATPPASILPPVRAASGAVVTKYLSDPREGLASTAAIDPIGFRREFRLDYIGGAAYGAVTDRFGSALGGGVNLFFSDILGNHNLNVIVQASGSLQDIGGQVAYTNLARRWNWGTAVSHIPYLSLFTQVRQGTIIVDGEEQPVIVYDEIRQRVFDSRAIVLTHYPISTTRRWELSGGVRRIGYSREVEQAVVYRGVVIDRSIRELDAPEGFNLAQGALAYVGDFSFFGFTSPTRGGRYRFEVEGTAGTLDFVTGLADYRRYFFSNPFTFAIRGFHFGRYGADAESDRLAPLFVGYPTLVRGYGESSFDIEECTRTSETNCPEFDRLVGSRIAVASAELRIPLFGTERFGLLNVPFLPLELVGFADAGMAWSSGDRVRFAFDRESTERVPVVSAGGSVRVNLFGYLVGEVFYAHPFQRPRKGWHFGFQIAPGW